MHLVGFIIRIYHGARSSERQICRLTYSCDSMAGICILCCSVFVTRHLFKSVSVIFIRVYFWNSTLNCLLCGALLELYMYISHVDTSRKPLTLSNVFVCCLSYTHLKSVFFFFFFSALQVRRSWVRFPMMLLDFFH